MWTADIRMKWRCDHRSCDCDLRNRKLSPKCFLCIASALALQCSTNWAMKTHVLGEGQFTEFIVRVKGMKHRNIMWTADKRIKWRYDHRVTQRPWVRTSLKPRKHFSGLICDCLNRSQNCDDHIFISILIEKWVIIAGHLLLKIIFFILDDDIVYFGNVILFPISQYMWRDLTLQVPLFTCIFSSTQVPTNIVTVDPILPIVLLIYLWDLLNKELWCTATCRWTARNTSSIEFLRPFCQRETTKWM